MQSYFTSLPVQMCCARSSLTCCFDPQVISCLCTLVFSPYTNGEKQCAPISQACRVPLGSDNGLAAQTCLVSVFYLLCHWGPCRYGRDASPELANPGDSSQSVHSPHLLPTSFIKPPQAESPPRCDLNVCPPHILAPSVLGGGAFGSRSGPEGRASRGDQCPYKEIPDRSLTFFPPREDVTRVCDSEEAPHQNRMVLVLRPQTSCLQKCGKFISIVSRPPSLWCPVEAG